MSVETLALRSGETLVEVAPSRGALVTRLSVRGRELLYLDRATLDDPTKNVRGGVPFLFPFAGKLDGGLFVPAGTTMKQHGFARDRAFGVAEQGADFVRLRLCDDADTRAVYPYAFTLDHSIHVLPRGLSIELRVAATDATGPALPVCPGWHPYFSCEKSRKREVKVEHAGVIAGQISDEKEFDFGLPAPSLGQLRFAIPALGATAIRLSWSANLRHLQFWSQPGKDFVCIEPFGGPANTINGPDKTLVAPGQAQSWSMRIELDDEGMT